MSTYLPQFPQFDLFLSLFIPFLFFKRFTSAINGCLSNTVGLVLSFCEYGISCEAKIFLIMLPLSFNSLVEVPCAKWGNDFQRD